MTDAMRHLNFICTDTGKFFALKDNSKPYHLVAGTKETDMLKLTNHITRIGKSQNALVSSVKNKEITPCGMYTIAIDADDIPECIYDEKENVELHTISLEDMHSNNFLMDTLMYSGLNIFIVENVEFLENSDEVRMEGVILNGGSIESFISSSQMCTQNLSQYFEKIYNLV